MLDASFKYFRDILNENCGVKALVTDEQTLTVMSMAMTRTELFSNEVISTVEIRELCRKPVNHITSSLKSVVILRPTEENVELLSNELAGAPHFARYSVYFTNTVQERQIRQLAKFDKFGLVDRVEEVYLDLCPLKNPMFSLNLPSLCELRSDPLALFISRITDGIFAALCSLQLRPCIRYGANSRICATIAKCVADRTTMVGYTQPTDNACLLVIDRTSDPIAALLHPWFYIGAIHDLFGIRNNVVAVPGRQDHLVIDERHDTFLQQYQCCFLADVGPAVADGMGQAKELNEEAKQTIRTPDQIADVVNAATQFQEQFSLVGNHVSFTSAINDRVTDHHLIVVGELEQGLATNDDPTRQCQEILRLSEDPNIPHEAIIRLLLLFALRYEKRAEEQMNKLMEAFPREIELMKAVVEQFGSEKRTQDNILAEKGTLTQFFTDIRALCDAQPKLLDQYKCLLTSIIDRVKKGKLSPDQYPFVTTRRNEATKPRMLIVFYVGGVTYTEMRAAHEATDIDVIVGGTFVHNADSFIKNEVEAFAMF